MTEAELPKSELAGRVLLSLATLNYGLVPPLVDLTETHVFHPDWTPHSRMHMVWLLGTNSSVAVLSLYLLWLYSERRTLGVRLAFVLGVCVYGGFFLAAATGSLYGGALSDRGGVPPVFGVDANIFGFSVAFVMLLAGWALARPARRLNA